MDKYGMVYLWFDKKHKRYYVGSHWGSETDGYICSSRWMRNSYKRRPEDFKRRIISKVFDRKEVLREEFRFLSMMKPEELGSRYYNLQNREFNHWTTDPNSLKTVGEKISAAKKGKKTTMTLEQLADRGRTISEVRLKNSKKPSITIEMIKEAFRDGSTLKKVQERLGAGSRQLREIVSSAGYSSLREVQPKRRRIHSPETLEKLRRPRNS